jgi:hypothetical protein
MSSNDRAIRGVILIVMTMIVMGIGANVICAIAKVPAPDFGVKEVVLSLGGGLVGFLTGVGYAQPSKKPDAPSIQTAKE